MTGAFWLCLSFRPSSKEEGLFGQEEETRNRHLGDAWSTLRRSPSLVLKALARMVLGQAMTLSLRGMYALSCW
jgi:hypothetical protein